MQSIAVEIFDQPHNGASVMAIASFNCPGLASRGEGVSWVTAFESSDIAG